MDRSWMYTTGLRRQYKEYRDDVLSFMKAAVEDRIRRNDKYMCCPCSDCRNEIWLDDEKEVHAHLIRRGFMERYTCWVMHGEQESSSSRTPLFPSLLVPFLSPSPSLPLLGGQGPPFISQGDTTCTTSTYSSFGWGPTLS